MAKEMTIEQIQALMDSMHKNEISELVYEVEEFRLKIKGQQAPSIAPAPAPDAAVQAAPVAVAVAAAEASVPAPEKQPEGKVITSPIVGTFYAASSPDKDPFVKVGQAVSEGDIVFIVESMKVMNEVPADKSGVVAEVLVENGAPVEYGQPVLRLE